MLSWLTLVPLPKPRLPGLVSITLSETCESFANLCSQNHESGALVVFLHDQMEGILPSQAPHRRLDRRDRVVRDVPGERVGRGVVGLLRVQLEPTPRL